MSEPRTAKPSENFRKAVRQILSVPKAELERREGEYKKHRKLRASGNDGKRR